MTNSDFRYFINRVLGHWVDDEVLTRGLIVPSFENLPSIKVTDKLIKEFVEVLWFNTKVSTAIWKKFMDEHESHVFKSRDTYISSALHMLRLMNKSILDYHERLMRSFAAVTSLACYYHHKNQQDQYIHFTAAILMIHFEKKLKRRFMAHGGWRRLEEFVHTRHYRGYYKQLSNAPDLQLQTKIEKEAKKMAKYQLIQGITPDTLKQYGNKDLLVEDVVICYINEVAPHIEPKFRRLEKRTEELGAILAELSLSKTPKGAEAAESSTVSTEPGRQIQMGVDQTRLRLQDSIADIASDILSTESDHQSIDEVRQDFNKSLTDFTDSTNELLSKCQSGQLHEVFGERDSPRAEASNAYLVTKLQDIKLQSIDIAEKVKKTEKLGLPKSYCRHISKCVKGFSQAVRKQKTAVLSAVSSKVYGPLKAVQPQRFEVVAPATHRPFFPDPFLLPRGRTRRPLNQCTLEDLNFAKSMEYDNHEDCEHRKLHPFPKNDLEVDLSGYEPQVAERLKRAEADRSFLLRVRSMIYDAKCQVDRHRVSIYEYSLEN